MIRFKRALVAAYAMATLFGVIPTAEANGAAYMAATAAAAARAEADAVALATNEASGASLLLPAGGDPASIRFGQIRVSAIDSAKTKNLIGVPGHKVDPTLMAKFGLGGLFVVVTKNGNRLDHRACHLGLVAGIVTCGAKQVDPVTVTQATRAKLKEPSLIVTGVGYNYRDSSAIIFFAIP